MKITQNELNEIIRLHGLWLNDKKEGKKADLRDADLRNLDLTNVNLSYADSRNADLSNLDLTNVDLQGVDLRGADSTNTILDDDDEVIEFKLTEFAKKRIIGMLDNKLKYSYDFDVLFKEIENDRDCHEIEADYIFEIPQFHTKKSIPLLIFFDNDDDFHIIKKR